MTSWINGEFYDAGAKALSPNDRGLLVGDGVFETLRVYNGVPFAWDRHMARLERSAAGMDLATPGRDTLRQVTDDLLQKDGLTSARLRITITDGVSNPGLSRAESTPTVIVAATPFKPWPQTIDVVVAPWPTNPNSPTVGIKTISYASSVKMFNYAESKGATETIVFNTRDELCEAAAANVFLVKENVVKTPPLESGCLSGVTRSLILELCMANGIEQAESTLYRDDLDSADEVFLSASTRQVQPVAKIDDRSYEPVPGPMSNRVAQLFDELVARNINP